MKKIFLVLMVGGMGFFALACGYTTKSALPPSLKTIYVAPFQNKIDYTAESSHRSIYVPLLEVNIHDAVVDRFLFDGKLHIAPEDRADLILKGELVSYDRGALRYTDNMNVQEYRIQIIVHLTLQERDSGEIVWEENGFAGEATYFVSGPSAKSESTAIQDATTDLARRIVERTIENW